MIRSGACTGGPRKRGSAEEFAYDPVAHLLRSVDPLGVVSEYSYDELRPVELRWIRVWLGV